DAAGQELRAGGGGLRGLPSADPTRLPPAPPRGVVWLTGGGGPPLGRRGAAGAFAPPEGAGLAPGAGPGAGAAPPGRAARGRRAPGPRAGPATASPRRGVPTSRQEPRSCAASSDLTGSWPGPTWSLPARAATPPPPATARSPAPSWPPRRGRPFLRRWSPGRSRPI